MKVYTTIPFDIDDLKSRIILAFREITVEIRVKVILEYRERLYKLYALDGGHVESI